MQDPSRLEPATDENFVEQLYLAANPDVARHVAAGGDAWKHFERHGRKEGRKQLTRAAAGLPGTRAEAKYARFAPILDASRGAGGAFAFLAAPDSFPVGYGATAHDLGDYDAESANPGLGDFVETVRANPDRLYLDVGCGRRSRTFDNCLYLEVYPSVSADLVIEPACRYPIADASLDGIGCFAVMEHMAEPWIAAADFARMLKPGGMLFIDYPFLVPVHGYPSHYYNATREGLARLFDDGFERVKLTTEGNQTPDHALHWQLNGLAEALTDDAVRDALKAMSVAELMAEPPGGPFWQRVMAATPEKARSMFAAGNTLIARKL
ncbi:MULTISPECIES: class I SAM-dependent methyltransferase [unclassified Sphingomonas]|uniref:class I SAM-dependent methyltransferase n=1 Tax=unclassified Sphingomonas TaxID=196159 RepID=UPI0006F6CB27|nr:MULTISPECIES: methyltransferase domain-containing protein [unclassified Sphingomonas]KQX22754.1 methyltransferase type 11 [Sphingomonas sp. Root1294]KQY67768.1 methyltransferase type 11 [Sphingomonas sp. Root50]KRB88690.1 methyltransferase type 11 [Sphingomonas sp. Root720]